MTQTMFRHSWAPSCTYHKVQEEKLITKTSVKELQLKKQLTAELGNPTNRIDRWGSAITMPSVPVVLLVDDTPATLWLLVEQLGQKQYRVFVAASGESALEFVRYEQPDIILLDVLMPGLDGFETCRLLKANPATREIPVLFASDPGETVDKAHGFAIGGVDHINKPLQALEVLARLDTHLGLHHSQQMLQRQNASLEEEVLERTVQLQAELERRARQEDQKHKLLELLEQQSGQLRELTSWLFTTNQEHHQNLPQNRMSHLTALLQQAYRQLEITEAIVLTNQNTTERLQLKTQVEHLRIIVNQLKIELNSIAEAIAQSPTNSPQMLEDPLLPLSAREREIFQLIVDGKSTSQIAALLYLSEITVRGHRSSLLQKLQLEDIIALIKFAVKNNLVTV